MSLLENWREYAYSQDTNQRTGQLFWANYFNMEKEVYHDLLSNPDTVITGSVSELAERYHMDVSHMVGVLDGINESLKNPNPIETMEEDTMVSLDYDKEKLYYNMVGAKAEWLYELPQWNELLSEERRKELFREQKQSGTVRKDRKVGRNDPCPCGSGKKYKQCCGRNA